MTEKTKQSLQLSLEILRRTCIDNGVSIAVNKENGDLNFFDTAIYLNEKRLSRFKVKIQDLVQ